MFGRITSLAVALGMLTIVLLFPGNLPAKQEQEEEKMMLRGTINMETTRRHQHEIGESFNESTWRHATRNEVRTQKATVQIQAADIFYSGDIDAEGTVHASVRHRNRSGFRKRDGKWSLNKSSLTGEGQTSISGEMIKISMAPQANIDAAPNIQQALSQCGGNPECLENALKQFTRLLEDKEKSFRVKIVVMLLADCKGSMTTVETAQSYTPRQGTKTTTDGPHVLTSSVCQPMAFEMDGTYTRGGSRRHDHRDIQQNGGIPVQGLQREKLPHPDHRDMHPPSQQRAARSAYLYHRQRGGGGYHRQGNQYHDRPAYRPVGPCGVLRTGA